MNMKKIGLCCSALALVLLTSACKPEPSGTTLIMGDSIAVGVSADVSSRLLMRNNAPLVLNNSIAGITASQDNLVQYWVGRVAASNADVIIVSLGGNDTGRIEGDLYDTLYPALYEIMESMQGAEVYWMIHQEGTLPQLEDFRYTVKSAANNFDYVTVLDMPLGVLGADGVHLTKQGVTEVSTFLVNHATQ